MGDFKIKVKDVKAFVIETRHLYASGKGKRFYVALRAGPNVERYIVEVEGTTAGFTKLGEAVQFFNGN